MARGAFSDTVWQPGQPLDPTSQSMTIQELSDRVLYIEKALTDLQVVDLPVADLQRQLEQSWIPDPATLLAAGSVTREVLATAWTGGTVTAAGGKSMVVAGSPDWSVVRNAIGDYTITFPAYKAIPLAFGTPALAVSSFRYSAKTTSTVRFQMSADSDFDWMVWGK